MKETIRISQSMINLIKSLFIKFICSIWCCLIKRDDRNNDVNEEEMREKCNQNNKEYDVKKTNKSEVNMRICEYEVFAFKNNSTTLNFENESSSLKLGIKNYINLENSSKFNLEDEDAKPKLETINSGVKMEQLKEKTQVLKTKLSAIKPKAKEPNKEGANEKLKKITEKLHIKSKKTGNKAPAIVGDISKLRDMVSNLAEKSRLKKRCEKATLYDTPSFGRKTSLIKKTNNADALVNHVNSKSDRRESYIEEIYSEYRNISSVENI